MAQTKIWPIGKRLYKTIAYVMRNNKTWCEESSRNLISGVGVDCNTAQTVFDEFMETKAHWGKLNGRLAYHAEQSFKPGEVTPELAHEIGVKFANEVWGDRFEVLVTTHLDRDHIHNHFVINSVSYADGYKYHEPNEEYYGVIQKISDRICKENNLSVIEPKGNTRYKPRQEVKPEPGKPPTMRMLIYQDIDNAIQMSENINQFYDVLKQMGYEVKRFNSNGEPLAHPAIKPPPDSDGTEHHFFRVDKFTDGYTEEDIKQRIEDRILGKEDNGKFINLSAQPADGEPTAAQKKSVYWRHVCGPAPKAEQRYMYSGVVLSRRVIRYRGLKYRHYLLRRVDWYGLRKNFMKLCFVLKSVERTSYPSYPSHELRREAAKLHQYSEETMLLHKHKIDTLEQLIERQSAVDEGIFNVNSERRRLRRAIKSAAPEETAALQQELDRYKQLAKELYHERALLKDIAERSQAVEQNVQNEQEKAAEPSLQREEILRENQKEQEKQNERNEEHGI